MKKTLLLAFVLTFTTTFVQRAIGQTFSITSVSRSHISLHFELSDFAIDTIRQNGELMHTIVTKSIVVPNEYGQPDLPSFNRFIAIPQGAQAIVEVRTTRDERMAGINIMPSCGSQCENDTDRLFYKDQSIYSVNAFFPNAAVQVAEPQSLRGVDVVHLGVCPVQFNPVTREIAIHRQLDIEIRFEGGNGHFGDDRLRSPYWDPILRNNILNYNCLEPIDYDARMQRWIHDRPTGCEYLIITPDNEAFYEAAQELVDFRMRQGILTKVMRVTETGATNSITLRQWFRDIYENWDIPPVAVCLIGESGDDLQHYVPGYRTLHPKDNFIISDNPYADVNYDFLPDMCFTRLIAQNESELPIFIGKQLEYEYTNPVQDQFYYSHPLTAAGWQNSKWFQISIATVSCYLAQHGKTPTRINEIYDGTLGDGWSTASGTSSVVGYFGPEGIGRIPASPHELGGWTGGTASQVISAINAGAYIVQHRDHGWNTKWYQPEIYTSDFDRINNAGKMTFLISINCRTGMYNESQTCFTEALIRMTRSGQNAGIVGAIAPTGQTYSFANDIFLWGIWDMFDPEFLPGYGPHEAHSGMWLPAFACVAGKYFLDSNVFPSTDESMRQTTFNTFHSHGDAFLRLFTEMPQPIETTHDESITCYKPFHITAPEGSQIALSWYNGAQFNILATATGTGQSQTLNIYENVPTDFIHLTITGQNLLRHEEDIVVNHQTGAFVVVDSISLNGGSMSLHYDQPVTTDITLINIGPMPSPNGTVNLSSSSEYVSVTQGEASFSSIQPRETRQLNDAVHFNLSDGIPDGTRVPITLTTNFGEEPLNRSYDITILSPDISAQLVEINDYEGNPIDYLYPGEFASVTIRLTNCGHYFAHNPQVSLLNDEGYVRVITPPLTIDDMEIEDTAEVTFDIYVEYIAGESPLVTLILSTLINNLRIDRNIMCPTGFITDGFENGSFNPEYWTNDAQHPWAISSHNAYEGNHCAASDTITHNESSTLTLTFNSTEPGNITFYSKVSSEGNYDFLVFSIDSVMNERWSGEWGWEEHSYPVEAGLHNFTWSYIKDHSVSTGDDRAYLDYVMFPPKLDALTEQAEQSLELHPNPTTDHIFIKLEQEDDFVVKVFDAYGKLILSQRNVTDLSFVDRPAGLYHIMVEQNEKTWSRKIIKM